MQPDGPGFSWTHTLRVPPRAEAVVAFCDNINQSTYRARPCAPRQSCATALNAGYAVTVRNRSSGKASLTHYAAMYDVLG